MKKNLIFALFIALSFTCASSETLKNLRAQDFTVRVEIVRSYWNIKAVLSGPFFMRDNRNRIFSSYATGKTLKISAVDTSPRKTIYFLALKTFPYEKEAEARQCASRAQKLLGLHARAIKPLKPKSLVVVTGSFSSYHDAASQLSKAKRFYSLASIRKQLDKPVGMIRIQDSNGNILGTFENFVSLVPKRQQARTIMSGIKYSWDDWKESHHGERTYRGKFEFRLNHYGKLICINILHPEEYLYGILPMEMGDFAPLEALKAQAISARSEALRKVNSSHHMNDPFDFCNEMHCQVYHGARFEKDPCTRAVDETRGLILTHNDRIIDAVYSHSCGGSIAHPGDLWRGSNEPTLVGHLDREGEMRSPDLSGEETARMFLAVHPKAFCNPDHQGFPTYARKYFRWTHSTTVKRLSTHVNNYYKIGRIKDISITGRASSGRVRGVLLTGESGQRLLNTEQRIRVGLGRLYSTLFFIEKETDPDGNLTTITFHGGGFGHGVGLCQMGAFMMAKYGYTYREILNHYFHGAQIRNIY